MRAKSPIILQAPEQEQIKPVKTAMKRIQQRRVIETTQIERKGRGAKEGAHKKCRQKIYLNPQNSKAGKKQSVYSSI